jgi:hypothetical protein
MKTSSTDYPFAPGVIDHSSKRKHLVFESSVSVGDFFGACLLAAMAYFFAGWLL